uniref:Cdh-4 protein n=1 Tax=Fopius arisanus TaxID=64838 RepID=A0A0C9PLD5_9HYME
MEEEEDYDKFFERRRRSESQPSIYRSTQSNLNSGSQQTLYHSLRNTMYEDAISMETLNADDQDETSTLTTDETLLEGNYGMNGDAHSVDSIEYTNKRIKIRKKD